MVTTIALLLLLLITELVARLAQRRNNRVHEKLTSLNWDVYHADMSDLSDQVSVHSGITWRRKYLQDGPSYDEMYWKFWRSVDSFYPPVTEWRR